MRAPEPLVIVFARAPVAGRVKTRLAGALGAQAAARLAARLIERALTTALAARLGGVQLQVAPGAGHSYLRRLARRHRVPLRAQRGADLGERMDRALGAALRRARAAILIGSDCPSLRAADLRRAARLLRSGASAAFAPAEDGGYALVALRRREPRLFRGIAWGGAGVMQATRERLRELGWAWRELRTVWDVDRPADCARLRSERLLARRP